MTAPPIAAAPPDATPPAKEQIKDRRHRGFWAAAERTGNTVFLFYLNPLLDEDTNRLSGTRCMAWVIVWVNTLDIVKSHSLAELRIVKTVDAIDLHNVYLFALAAVIWYGKWGFQTLIELVKAWRGREDK